MGGGGVAADGDVAGLEGVGGGCLAAQKLVDDAAAGGDHSVGVHHAAPTTVGSAYSLCLSRAWLMGYQSRWVGPVRKKVMIPRVLLEPWARIGVPRVW